MPLVDMTYTIKPVSEQFKLTAAPDGPAFALGNFTLSAAGTTITVVPNIEYDDVEAARAALEPLLADLEVEWDLRGFPITIELSTAHTSVVDGEEQRHALVLEEIVGLTGTMSAEITVTFEAPSGAYRATPIVDMLRRRWLSNARRVTEPPAAAAYALVTFFERLYGGRKGAAGTLNVSKTVLDKVGQLSAKSDPLQGRKFGTPDFEELDPIELGWLSEFIQKVGKRAASVESGHAPGAAITMADLPTLP
jgi:hypothetical protein